MSFWRVGRGKTRGTFIVLNLMTVLLIVPVKLVSGLFIVFAVIRVLLVVRFFPGKRLTTGHLRDQGLTVWFLMTAGIRRLKFARFPRRYGRERKTLLFLLFVRYQNRSFRVGLGRQGVMTPDFQYWVRWWTPLLPVQTGRCPSV